jgi:hypothetical protein
MRAPRWGQKSQRGRFRSRPRWQNRKEIPRAYSHRALYRSHSGARLQQREAKIRRSIKTVEGLGRFLNWMMRMLGLVPPEFSPPPPPENYHVEV